MKMLSTFLLLSNLIGVGALAEQINMPPSECLNIKNFLYSQQPPWLSKKEKFDPDDASPFHIAALLGLSNKFDTLGKDLVVVPVIDPFAFTPPSLHDSDFSKFITGRDAQISRYVSAGIDMVDIWPATESFPDDVFFHRRTDHHWTAEGAARSAQLVAAHLVNSKINQFDDWYAEFQTFPTKSFNYTPPIFRDAILESCELDGYHIVDSIVDFPAKELDGDLNAEALFGNVDSQSIAVIGSSHTAGDTGFVFPRGIEYYSGTPVIRHTIGGGGATTPMFDFIQSGGMENNSISKVVWVPSDLAAPEQITGASVFGAGLLSEECTPDSFFYNERRITAKYGEWSNLHEVIGLANLVTIQADQNEKLEFEVTLSDNTTTRFEVFFGGGFNKDEPFEWKFRFPFEELSTISQLSITAVNLRLTGSREYEPTGDVEYTVVSCGQI